MTRRERIEQRLELREEWAAKRRARAQSACDRASAIGERFAGGQPILVGHHSERGAVRDRERMDGAMRQAVDSTAMAAHHKGKAVELNRMLDHTIFSDDEDAPDRLAERIAKLEARRDAMKRGNTAFKRGGAAALVEAVGEVLARHAARTLEAAHWEKAPFPSWELTNLGANIRRLRGRLVAVNAAADQRRRVAEALATESNLSISSNGSSEARDGEVTR